MGVNRRYDSLQKQNLVSPNLTEFKLFEQGGGR